MEHLIDQLTDIENQSIEDYEKIQDEKEILDFKSHYLNKKSGKISEILKLLPQLSIEEKKEIGKRSNILKSKLENLIKKKEEEIKNRQHSNQIDLFQPGVYISSGTTHILRQVLEDCVDILTSVGFEVVEGPDIEVDYYNFESLNIPEDHPARDMHDTFYINETNLLRTHTSPVQVRTMEKIDPPVMMISPGMCFRKDTPDATHSPVFQQIEGLCVDKDVSFADLKGVLTYFFQSLFSKDLKLRFRPSYFPFTEPSTEVDISCIFCGGEGCSVCKRTGWIEVAGAGLVDPNVYRYVNYDPEIYSGYAFGIGIERMTMLKYQINDIRLFYENDLNFLKQF